ncbi:MAG: 50S ribosomal protein L15e [archaeon]
MGYLKYIKKLYRNPNQELREIIKNRLIEWRTSDSVTRVDKPLRIDRARALGYKDKQGFVVARVKLLRAGRQRPQIKKGRKTRNARRKKVVGKNYQWIAEERAARRFPNCEVMNSYKIGKDGMNYFFEVILVDKNHPSIKSDKDVKWIASSQHRGRVFRGLTSAARKSRGLRGKGKGYEKNRPSLAAHGKRGKN